MPTGSPPARIQRTGHRIGLLSTYPPKLCGLATFASALNGQLTLAGDLVTVVAVDDGHEPLSAIRRPDHVLVNGQSSSVREAARVLSRSDVAIVQHEYGIYGGVDGDEVLDLLDALEVPSIVVVHTVPSAPTPHQLEVLESVCDLATKVVVMTAAAGSRLLAGYDVDASKVVNIPHGAAAPVGDGAPGAPDGPGAHLLTWGLLGPGKGIEHVVNALSLMQDLRPRIRYTVAGATHPNVFARDGDQYRHSLIQAAWANGVARSITFDDTYRDVPSLTRLVSTASLVVLPYDSVDQVTSGVLVDAIASGRPVIATAFPHAVELLSDGAGIVVPHRDPVALATAIRAALSDPSLLASMAARAAEIAPSLSWRAVAERYRRVCDDLAPTAVRVAM